MTHKKDLKRGILLVLFLGVISVGFLTIFSLSTSFLYENKFIGWDSDIFLSMGKFAKAGLVPYKDFFDHKGPFIIFVEWLGYVIGDGKQGVFLIQIVFLTASLCGVYKILRLHCEKKASLLLTVASLLILNMYFDKGNLTEEFCLPFLVLSLYLAVRNESHAESDKELAEKDASLGKYIKAEYVLYGVTFMVGAMTRLTNSLPIAVILAVKVAELMKKKQWRKLAMNLWWFVVGNLIVFVPVVIYFMKVGALKEMFYATFIYNFKHGFKRNTLTTGELVNMTVLAVPLVITLLAGVMALITDKKIRKLEEAQNGGGELQNGGVCNPGMIVLLQSVVAILLLVISRPYSHYLMVWVPAIVLGMALLNKYHKNKRVVCIVLFSVLGVAALGKLTTAGLDIRDNLTSSACQIFDAEAKEIVSEIPEQDSDKVIAYNVKSRFYVVTDLLPCYKNFALQGLHSSMDDVERQEFVADMKSLEAKYIVTGMNDDACTKFIEEHYRLEKSTRIFRLFVRE